MKDIRMLTSVAGLTGMGPTMATGHTSSRRAPDRPAHAHPERARRRPETLGELEPRAGAWRREDLPGFRVAGAIAISRWVNPPLVAISSLNYAELPDGTGVGLQWHVSVSAAPRRARKHEVRQALRDFGMEGAEEDGHHPGIARHYWLPLDPSKRLECQCKDDELTIVEPDGYRWTTPVGSVEDRAICRGCEHEATFGRPCPIHVAGLRPEPAS